MALSGKREDLIHVPWSSVEEWHQVYKEIYLGDISEQSKAYETLLVWKARIPKLSVGIECTLGLLQVCLRDREWTPKIVSGEMAISYENDLRMMYSTVIMKFLNHISNIAHNKQTSLFVIAKQLNIPDWIVDLRHDTAHGHELPSIDVMRVVANILLTWLHEEYWAAEAKNLQVLQEKENSEYFYSEDEENIIDLIELWTAVNLYKITKHTKISDLPDTEIRENLNNLFQELNVKDSNGKEFSVTDETDLSTVSNLLLSEVSKNLGKGDSFLRKEKIIIESIINNEAFIANSEILSVFIDKETCVEKNCLPELLIDFWKDFLLLLQEKKILLSLFLQLIELLKKVKDTNKNLLASLWVKAIAQAYNKQKIAKLVYQTLEQKCDAENQTLSSKAFLKNVYNEVDKCYPELKNVLTLNVNGDFPNCLKDETFVKRLILNFDEFSEHYIPEILKISSFLDSDSIAKEKLLKLMEIYSLTDKEESMEVENSGEAEKIYTVDDIKKVMKNKKNVQEKSENNLMYDNKIRNLDWGIAPDDCDWSSCPIGVLPWQMNEPINTPIVSPSEVHYAIVKNVELPKIIDSSKLQHNKIQWENLIKKQKKTKRKPKSEKTVMDRAMENVQSMKEQSVVS